MDSTGDFLTLVPLRDRDPANASPAPSSCATSPAPSSISAATSPILSVKSTAVVASPSSPKSLRLNTLFNIRRGYHVPLVSLTERKDDTQQHDVPPAPAPVSLGPAADWMSWLGGLVGSATSVTGDQIDALCTWWYRWWRWSRSSLHPSDAFHFLGKFGSDVVLVWLLVAGPDRPVPEKPKARATQEGYTEWEAGPSKAGAIATSAARTNDNLYNRLHSAVAERGSVACAILFICVC